MGKQHVKNCFFFSVCARVLFLFRIRPAGGSLRTCKDEASSGRGIPLRFGCGAAVVDKNVFIERDGFDHIFHVVHQRATARSHRLDHGCVAEKPDGGRLLSADGTALGCLPSKSASKTFESVQHGCKNSWDMLHILPTLERPMLVAIVHDLLGIVAAENES